MQLPGNGFVSDDPTHAAFLKAIIPTSHIAITNP
jgi:hypothetical protein